MTAADPFAFDDLDFTPLADAAPEATATIKAAVLASGAVKLTLSAGAYARLGKPPALAVAAATRDGDAVLRLQPAAEGHGLPLVEREAPQRKTARAGGGRPSAAVTLRAHPFAPGVVHRGVACATVWRGERLHVEAFVTLPDWAAMRAELDG